MISIHRGSQSVLTLEWGLKIRSAKVQLSDAVQGTGNSPYGGQIAQLNHHCQSELVHGR